LSRISLKGVDPRLIAFTTRNGLKVTSARGGKHNVGSKHYIGEALDFSVRVLSNGKKFPPGYWEHLERDAEQHNLVLLDERTRPPGQVVWGGAHGHIQTP
jgi:hypothetical protein